MVVKCISKKNLLIAVVLLAFNYTFGQSKQDIVEGSSFIFKGREPLKLFQNNDSSYLFLTSGHFGIYATSLSEELNKVKGKVLHMNYETKQLNYVETIYFSGKYLVFMSYRNRKQKKTFLFYSVLNPKNLKLSKSPVKVAEMPNSNSVNEPVKFIVKQSPNAENLLIIGLPASKQFQEFGIYDRSKISVFDILSDGKANLNYWVMSDKMRIIKQSDDSYIRLTNPFKQLFFIDYAIDDSSNVYVLCKNSNSKYRSKKQEVTKPEQESSKKIFWYEYSQSKYILTRFSSNGDMHQFVTDENYVIADLKFSYSSTQIDLIGLILGSKGLPQNPKSLYYAKLNNKDFGINTTKFMTLPEPYYNKVVTCKSMNGGDVTFALEKLSFNQTTVHHTKVTKHQDGSTTTKDGLSPVYLDFKYGDIFIGKMDANLQDINDSSFKYLIVPRERETRFQHLESGLINDKSVIFPDVVVDIESMKWTKTHSNIAGLRIKIPIYHIQVVSSSFLVLNQLNSGFQFIRYPIH